MGVMNLLSGDMEDLKMLIINSGCCVNNSALSGAMPTFTKSAEMDHIDIANSSVMVMDMCMKPHQDKVNQTNRSFD